MKCIYCDVEYVNLKGVYVLDNDVLNGGQQTIIMSGPYCSYKCMVAEIKENVL